MKKLKLSRMHVFVIVVVITAICATILYGYVSNPDIGIPAEISGNFRGMYATKSNFFGTEYELLIGNDVISNVTSINEREERYLVNLLNDDITLLLWKYESHYKYIGAYINE